MTKVQDCENDVRNPQNRSTDTEEETLDDSQFRIVEKRPMIKAMRLDLRVDRAKFQELLDKVKAAEKGLEESEMSDDKALIMYIITILGVHKG